MGALQCNELLGADDYASHAPVPQNGVKHTDPQWNAPPRIGSVPLEVWPGHLHEGYGAFPAERRGEGRGSAHWGWTSPSHTAGSPVGMSNGRVRTFGSTSRWSSQPLPARQLTLPETPRGHEPSSRRQLSEKPFQLRSYLSVSVDFSLTRMLSRNDASPVRRCDSALPIESNRLVLTG